MAYDILNKMKQEGVLNDCIITIAHPISASKTRAISGRDVTGIGKSGIEYRGGEAGCEILHVPLKSILGIERDGRVVYRKKKSIEKIYPRA
jgi:uncharacterized protein (UPF0248 family)